MAYTNKSKIRAATGFSDVEKISDTKIEEFIDDADGVIDSFIGGVYVIPLSSTPKIIGTVAKFIAVGLAYAEEYGEESQDTDKGWKGRLEWAMGILESIQSKKLKLYDSTGAELTRTSLGIPAFRPNAITVNEDSPNYEGDGPRLTVDQQF